MHKMSVDVAVIGAGPGGLAAAITAWEEGVEDVLLLERMHELGGILPQCIHNGFGLHIFNSDLTGPEYAQKFIDRAEELQINTKLNTMVLQIRPPGKIIAASAQEGLMEISSKSIVLAMGCRERTRGNLLIPGSRPAGIFTAGTAQRLINIEGYMPGKKVVILGSGDVGLIMARRLTLEGAEVVAVVEKLPFVGGSVRNLVQCVEDFNIPLFLEHTVTEIHGRSRVEAVTIAHVDQAQNVIPHTERKILCDTLLLSVGLIPENELSSAAGVALDPHTQGPIVSETRECSLPGLFACGNVVQVHDIVDFVTLEGRIAGKAAAECSRKGAVTKPQRLISVLPGRNVKSVVPQVLNAVNLKRMDEVILNLRVHQPLDDVQICVRSAGKPIFSTTRTYVRPNEMVRIELPVNEGLKTANNVTIDIEPQCGRK